MKSLTHASSTAVAGGRRFSVAGDWLLLLLPGLIWGASFLFIAEGLQSVGPHGLTLARLLAGFATLSILPAARRPIARSDRPGTALLGLIWMAFPLSMFPLAEQHVSSALTGLLNGANPLFTALVAAWWTRTWPDGRVALGLGIGLIGMMLISGPSLGEGQSSALGVGLTLAGVLSYGFALNLARPLQQRNGALPIIWRAQAVAIVLTLPLGLPELLNAQWTLRPALAVLALGALGTGAAYALLGQAAARFGATRASATTFLIPAVALGLGVTVRGEVVAPLAVAGGVLCVVGAAWMRRAH